MLTILLIVIIAVSSWSTRLDRLRVHIWSILFQNLVVSLSLAIFSFIELVFAFILMWESFVSFLTFVWLMCLIESSTLSNWLIKFVIILIIFPWIWRILSHIIVISRLKIILSEVIRISIHRSILIRPVFHWRVILNYVRLHLISGKLFSQRWILNSFRSWSTVSPISSILLSVVISIPILSNWSFWIDKNMTYQPFIFLFQIQNSNIVIKKYGSQMELFSVL